MSGDEDLRDLSDDEAERVCALAGALATAAKMLCGGDACLAANALVAAAASLIARYADDPSNALHAVHRQIDHVFSAEHTDRIVREQATSPGGSS